MITKKNRIPTKQAGIASKRPISRSGVLARAVCEPLEARRLLDGSATPTGITPAQMRHAYGADAISFGGIAGNGAGQTIAIVSIGADPNELSDLENFDAYYGLPNPPSFQRFDEYGGTNYPTVSVSGELAIDVQWAHVMAPQASIDVVECNSLSIADYFEAGIVTAASLPGVSVVSTSYTNNGGGPSTQYDKYFTTPAGHNGVTFVNSTGDSGTQGGVTNYPDVSPNVVAVGGTHLNLADSAGDYGSETGWQSSGGGISNIEPQPSFQVGKVNGLSTSWRTIPDVSMNASITPGMSFYDTEINSPSTPWGTTGGTSFAAPMFAGLIAVANQGRALAGLSTLDGPSQTLPRLYDAPSSDFHDILVGNNADDGVSYSCGPGYDLVTGIGTPIANLLVNDLAFIPSDFVVTNTSDSGAGSLRQVLTNADTYGEPVNISFDIPTSDAGYSNGVFTIKPQSQLPTLTNSDVTIDGNTQETYTGSTNGGRPVIFLNGGHQTVNGLMITGSIDKIANLGIDGFNGSSSDAGVVISGSGATLDSVEGCLIGIGPSGTSAAGNSIGVAIAGAAGDFINNGTGTDTIGYNTTGVDIISGSANTVDGDYIGATSAGVSIPNGTGILITCSQNTVADSTIDDNSGAGIELSGTSATGNTLISNTIGVSFSGYTSTTGGDYPAPNGTDGILITGGADNNQIGNTATASNLIAGNTGNGIEIDGSTGNIIENNAIGEATYQQPVIVANQVFIETMYSRNGAYGIDLHDTATQNMIGGMAAGTGNIISGNEQSGIEIGDSASSSNSIDGNYIGTDSAGDSIGNLGTGVYSAGSSETIDGNIISDNSGSGIELASNSNTVANNKIGTNPAGTAALANQLDGVLIFSGTNNVVNENTISGNTFSGIAVASSNNAINGNYIGLNAAATAAIPNLLQGVLVTGASNTMSGDVISGNVGAGIALEANNNTVHYCYIGLTAAGTAALSNGTEGIYVDSSGNLIGGASYATAGNVISGNQNSSSTTLSGILLDTSSATANYIEGNYIGTNAAGTAALPNYNGIVIQNSAAGNFIGNASVDVGNVISGNTNYGIYIASTAGANNLITTNFIGTNAAGTAAIGNAAGIAINAPNTTVGGAAIAGRNVISGNTGELDGIVVGVSGNDTIEGNYIGTNAAGTAAIANEVGVDIYSPATNVQVLSNVISGNYAYGVRLQGSSSTSSTIQGNLIGTDYTGTQPVGNGQCGIVDDTDKTVIGGQATGQGNTIDYNTDGGIYISTSMATVTDCTIYDNGGSGINNEDNLTIYNSTITGNTASSGAGIYSLGGTLAVDDVTITGNTANSAGGGIDVASGAVVLTNAIIAQNSGGDVSGAVSASSTYNLIGNGTGLTGISNGVSHNQVGSAASPINPELGSLSNNGGSTETLLPAINSPALNTGIGISSLSTDQRGGSRPTSGAVDIGAVQLQGTTVSIANSMIYLRLAADGQTLDIYFNNTGTGTPAATYVLANLASLAAAGSSSGGNELTVDFSNGSPIPAGNQLEYNATGGNNTLKVIGSAGNDTIDINPSNAGVGNSSFIYTGVQTRIVDPLTGSDSLGIGSDVTVSFPVAPTGGGIVTRNLSSLYLGIAATLIVPTDATRSTDRTLLIIQSATLQTAAKIDLGGNDADFTSTPLSTVEGWLTTGFASGAWNGTGINSSFAAADTTHLTALGAIQNNQGGAPIFSSGNTFDNTIPSAADVLVKYTYYGDANLDGQVDGSDYTRIDSAFQIDKSTPKQVTGWLNGDFNYDGLIDGSDYTLIDNAFNTQRVSLAAQIASSPYTQNTRTISLQINPKHPTACETPASAFSVFSLNIQIAIPESVGESIEFALEQTDQLDGQRTYDVFDLGISGW